jgi:hypothetical protein
VAGSTVSGTVNVQVNAGDNVGVTSVTYNLNGAPLGTSSSSPFSYAWNTTATANGSYTLTATARDAAGNQASASIAVIVSNPVGGDAPTISITSPVSNARVSGNVTVTVNVSGSVVRTELYVDGKLVGSSTNAPFTMSWHTKKSGTSTGWKSLTAKAYDSTGASVTSAPVSVFVAK